MATPMTAMPNAIPVKRSGNNGCLWVGLNLLFALFLAIGGWYGYRSFGLVQNGGVANGTVVNLEQHDSDDSTTYAPVVSYEVDGQNYHMTGSNASSPPAYHVGQKVRVRYDRDDPTLARIDNFWELWLLPVLFVPTSVLFGLIFNVYMFIGLFRRR